MFTKVLILLLTASTSFAAYQPGGLTDDELRATPVPVSLSSSPLPTGAATESTLSTINGKLTTNANSLLVDVQASALPTGAASAANQTTGNGYLGSLDTKINANFGAASGSVRVAAMPGNASGLADFGSGTVTSQTMRVSVATDNVIATKSPVNTAGSSPGTATVSTVATITAPANAVGFILMAIETNTANIRWRIGATATTTSGQQLQPGRDTVFVPCAANISIVAESGTQSYDIQWILSN